MMNECKRLKYANLENGRNSRLTQLQIAGSLWDFDKDDASESIREAVSNSALPRKNIRCVQGLKENRRETVLYEIVYRRSSQPRRGFEGVFSGSTVAGNV